MYKWHKTIQSSMFITYSLIIIMTVLIICILFYIWGSGQLKSQARTEISKYSTSISQSLDDQIRSMNSVSLNVIYSNLVKQTFYSYLLNSKGKSNKELANELNDTKELNDILMAAIGPNWLVNQINLYDFNGHMFGTGAFNNNIYLSVKDQVWYNKVISSGGNRFITLPHKDAKISDSLSTSSDEYYISLCREYFGQYNDLQGIVEVEQNYSAVFNLLKNQTNLDSKYEHVFVYNSSGDIIYPISEMSHKNSTDYFKYYKSGNPQTDYLTVNNKKSNQTELLSYIHSTYTG
jgi:two-component system, sensor histidine kinase YesM